MAMSGMAGDDSAVWEEAHASFEKLLAETLSHVELLQTAVVELASNHRLVAERLAAIHTETSPGRSMLREGSSRAYFKTELPQGGSDQPHPLSASSAAVASTSYLEMRTISEYPARRMMSGSYTGGAFTLRNSSENGNTNVNMLQQRQQHRQQLKRHAVFDALSRKSSLERAIMSSASSASGSHASDEELNTWTARQTRFCGGSRALHPHSTPMNLWEGVGSLALLIDSFAAPWFLAFYKKSDLVDKVIYWACLTSQVYWTLDIVINSIRGYWTSDTTLEMRILAAAKRYLRSWCLCDVVLVTATWLFLSAVRPNTSNESQAWHLSTSSHLYKVLLTALWVKVLTNIRKSVRVHENLKIYFLRWKGHRGYSLCIDFFTILCMIFNFNHVLSCVWYAIGELDTDTGSSWLVDGSAEQWSRQYFYSTSLHWSMSQMTPGSMEVVPHSTVERIYNVFVLMTGWFVAITLTGLVNSVMTGERLRIEERSKRFMVLQRFFLQEHVDHSLAMTANMQVKARRMEQERSRLRFPDIKDLEFVSKATREELSVSIFGQRMKLNGFFGLVEIFDPSAFATLCSEAVSSVTYDTAQVVFEDGSSGDRIIFVHHGRLKYVAGADACEYEWSKEDQRLTLQDRSWCSESALWSVWTYLGTMSALEQSDCVVISAADLCKCIQRKFHHVASLTSQFCQAVLWVHCNSDAKWSDLAIYVDHADIIASMSRQARILVGSALLAPRASLNRGWFSSGIGEKKMHKLHEEISNGEGFVCLHNGEVVRTLFLVTLRVTRSTDDKILVKLGQLQQKSRDLKAAAVLPGTKRREDESSCVAARRLVYKDLELLADTMEVDFNEPDLTATMQNSAYYGIRTRYLKTMYTALVKSTDAFPSRSFDLKAAQGDSQQLPSQGWTSHSQGASHLDKFSFRKFRQADRGGGLNSVANRSLSVRASPIDDVLYSITDVTIVPSSPGSDRDDVYVWLSDGDFEVLQARDAPEDIRKFLEVVRETLPEADGVQWNADV